MIVGASLVAQRMVGRLLWHVEPPALGAGCRVGVTDIVAAGWALASCEPTIADLIASKTKEQSGEDGVEERVDDHTQPNGAKRKHPRLSVARECDPRRKWKAETSEALGLRGTSSFLEDHDALILAPERETWPTTSLERDLGEVQIRWLGDDEFARDPVG